jgi:hypothetical protein
MNEGVGARERLSSLPWFSEDGSRRTADVQSIAGNAHLTTTCIGPPLNPSIYANNCQCESM